jgi:outer membrane lipoprotein carrier protein
MRYLPAILIGLSLAPAPALARRRDKPAAKAVDPAREAMEKIQKFYESTKDLHAKFDQAVQSGIGGNKKASGELWLKKPGRMRWEYAKPEKKLMVADGTTLWVYEPEDEQAFRQDLKSWALPSSVTFLLGTGKLTDEFQGTIEAAPAGAGGDLTLKLVPKQATAQYRYLVFVVDGKSFMVKETMVYDQQGGVNHMTFRDVELNRGVPDGKFGFSPPAGTKILRP